MTVPTASPKEPRSVSQGSGTVDRDPVDDAPDTGHDYDGIREQDNRLPNWWLATLFLTIVFGYGYWVYYHVLDAAPDQLARYEREMERAAELAQERARERGDLDDDALAALVSDEAMVTAGAGVFTQFCASCHGPEGGGLIGPNLTDPYWIHGGLPTQILHVISEGAPAKGMPAWNAVLGQTKVEQVTAYLLTIKGTEVAGKAPEGELHP